MYVHTHTHTHTHTQTHTHTGRTPLHVAALHGRLACAKALLAAAIKHGPQEQPGGSGEGGEGGERDLVKELIMSADCGGMLPLHEAAAGGHQAVIQMLLQAGTPVDEGDAKGRTALLCAAEERHYDVVRELITAGATAQLSHKQVIAALSGEPQEQEPPSFLQQAIMKVSPVARNIILSRAADGLSERGEGGGAEDGQSVASGAFTSPLLCDLSSGITGKQRRKQQRVLRKSTASTAGVPGGEATADAEMVEAKRGSADAMAALHAVEAPKNAVKNVEDVVDHTRYEKAWMLGTLAEQKTLAEMNSANMKDEWNNPLDKAISLRDTGVSLRDTGVTNALDKAIRASKNLKKTEIAAKEGDKEEAEEAKAVAVAKAAAAALAAAAEEEVKDAKEEAKKANESCVEEEVKEAENVVLQSAEGGEGCVEGGSDSAGMGLGEVVVGVGVGEGVLRVGEGGVGVGVGVGEGGWQQHGVFLVPAVPVDRYPITNSLMQVYRTRSCLKRLSHKYIPRTR